MGNVRALAKSLILVAALWLLQLALAIYGDGIDAEEVRTLLLFVAFGLLGWGACVHYSRLAWRPPTETITVHCAGCGWWQKVPNRDASMPAMRLHVERDCPARSAT